MKEDIECKRYRPEVQYSHLQEFIDNLPYILMTLLGASILFIGFDLSIIGWISGILFVIYGISGTLWFIIFICPYCHFFDTRACPCGYGQIAVKFRKQRDGDRFNEKFKKHIPVIVPLWIIPPIAGLIFLIIDFSIIILVLMILFMIDAFIILPLISRKYGCAHCPQKDTCPWMKLENHTGKWKMSDSSRNWINPKIVIRDSPIHGRGMFAKSRIEKGELLTIWKECYTNRIGAMEAIRNGKGVMQWDEEVYSYETDLHEEDYMINHSCDPNTWMSGAYSLEARKDISEDEEITVDIALFESDENSITEWNCNCGSPLCRGKVTGKDWRDEELQRKYKDHFSPLLKKRIKGLK